MQKILISAKVSPEWVSDLKDIAASQNQTVSELLRSIVGEYLGRSTKSTRSTLADRVAAIEARLAALESPTPVDGVDDDAGWITQGELCELYNLSYQNLATRAREHGGVEAYLLYATGFQWQVKKVGRMKHFRKMG